MNDSNESLPELVDQIRNCNHCLVSPQKKKLPHLPRPVVVASTTAKICIAGQAPGMRVHKSGRPFTDPSGDRLRQWLNVTEAQFYNPDLFAIVPMGFCFPGYDAKGGDLPPRPECAKKWHDRLFQTMDQLELLILVGAYAHKWHLKKLNKGGVSKVVAQYRYIYENTNEPKMIPLPHPSWRNSSWLRKNPWFDKDVIPFLRDCVQAILE